MDQIIVVIQPFSLKQQINIYKGNNHISTNCFLKDINKSCFNLCKQYHINNLTFYGNINFISKLKEKFITEYNNCGIDINLISK